MHKLSLSGEIGVNCYIIEHNNKCFIIDPGYEKEKIRKFVEEHNLTVEAILLTHGHLDHIGAIDCFDVEVFIHEDEYELLTNDELNGFVSLGISNPVDLSKINIQKFSADKKFYLDDKEVSVLHTPGHTKGSVCFVFDNMIFSGDTLFKGAVGRSDFPTGDINQLKVSIVSLIDSMDDSYEVHPGHNFSSTIKEEKLSNQYYNMWK